MVFLGSLRDSKSFQVSRTLLSILADLNNAVVWIVSIRPLISKSSSPCSNSLVTVPIPLITTGITVTFMFHSFFSSLFLFSFSFTLGSTGTPKFIIIIIIIIIGFYVCEAFFGISFFLLSSYINLIKNIFAQNI